MVNIEWECKAYYNGKGILARSPPESDVPLLTRSFSSSLFLLPPVSVPADEGYPVGHRRRAPPGEGRGRHVVYQQARGHEVDNTVRDHSAHQFP